MAAAELVKGMPVAFVLMDSIFVDITAWADRVDVEDFIDLDDRDLQNCPVTSNP